jgi:hypothetical protein
VDLNVTRKDFGQVLEQLRPVAILGVDQQVVLIRQWLAWPGIDRLSFVIAKTALTGNA